MESVEKIDVKALDRSEGLETVSGFYRGHGKS